MDFLRTDSPARITAPFFDRDAQEVARSILGKVLAIHQKQLWLTVRIIETEAYYHNDKASHASLGFTKKRQALFMPPGTIYMYYSRAGDSLNFSCEGAGNAVLVKSGYPVINQNQGEASLLTMQNNNPSREGGLRPVEKLCAGQTLLCKSLGLKVPDWDGQQLEPQHFELWDDGYSPEKVIQTRRLGIREDRDAHLPYRYIDLKFATNCTKNPLRVRNFYIGRDYTILTP